MAAEELELYGEPVVRGGRPVLAVSDVDRERAIGWLRHHCGVGTLDLDEFGDRALAVYQSTTDAQLWRALDGLGIAPAADVPVPTRVPAERRREGKRWHVAVFGGSERKGRWRIASSSVAVALFGGTDLDLRSVTLEDPDATEITITAVALFGGVDIVVPDGMEVDAQGIAIFGSKDVRLADLALNPSLPVLRVRTFSMFGGVGIRTRKDRRNPKVSQGG